MSGGWWRGDLCFCNKTESESVKDWKCNQDDDDLAANSSAMPKQKDGSNNKGGSSNKNQQNGNVIKATGIIANGNHHHTTTATAVPPSNSNSMSVNRKQSARDKERLQQEREKIVIWRRPLQTTKYCFLECGTLLQYYGKK